MASQPEEDDGTTASMGDSDHEDKIMDDVAGQNAAASDGEEMPRTEEKEEELSGYAKAAGHAVSLAIHLISNDAFRVSHRGRHFRPLRLVEGNSRHAVGGHGALPAVTDSSAVWERLKA